MTKSVRIAAVLTLAVTLSGCSTLYYSSMKKLGKEKRDILVSRIEDGKQARGGGPAQPDQLGQGEFGGVRVG